jgi:hypothetical protein
MGWFDWITEARKKKDAPSGEEENFEQKRLGMLEDIFTDLKEAGKLWEFLNLVRNVESTRLKKFEQYRVMAKDSVVASAMELIADDATQFDMQEQKIVWVESDDENLKKELNEFLHNIVDIDSRVWNWAYQIILYGEMYLRTFHSDFIEQTQSNAGKKQITDDGSPKPASPSTATVKALSGKGKEKEKPSTKAESAGIVSEDSQFMSLNEASEMVGLKLEKGKVFEEVDSPEKVYHITLYGKTVGYYEDTTKPGKTSSTKKAEGTLYRPEDFIHFMSDRGGNRETIELPIKDKNGEKEIKRKFKVKYGTSYIEGAVQAWQIVRLLEDVLVLSRISRSALIRLVSVNVGSADRAETIRMLKEVKNALKSKETFNPQSGYYRSDNNPVPIADFVVLPVRNGKGDVQVQEIGGNVDVRQMVDFDNFLNKLFGALHVPRAFLGAEDQGTGGIGNTSLTRLDIRYARTVKRIVTCLKNGVGELCDYYLTTQGKSDAIGKFTITMTRINDAEETDRVADIANKAAAADSIVNILSNLEGALNKVNKERLVEYIFDLLGVDYDKFKLKPGEKADTPPEEEMTQEALLHKLIRQGKGDSSDVL